MRTYEQTHPWINFSLDLSRAPAKLWMMLGECQSKCEHIAGVPLRPTTADELHKVYLAKGAQATTAIEGNTLTEEQVREHLEGRLRLPPSQQYLEQEVENIIQGCNRIWADIARGERIPLTPSRIRELNRAVLNKLRVDEDVVPGKIRRHSVAVARYRGAPSEDCQYLLSRLCDWMNEMDLTPVGGGRIAQAVLRAVLVHLYLAWIHPFGDGNGRTARMVEFLILIESGVPTPAAHLLSNHYNRTRTEYYQQLDRASRSGGEVLPFMEYAVQGFLDGLREQLDMIREQQLDVVWRNYVHERFREKTSSADKRRRSLVLELSYQREPVQIGRLVDLSPEIAREYADKTPKTVSRDVNALQQMDLVEKTQDGVRACVERILAYLPPSAQTPDPNGSP